MVPFPLPRGTFALLLTAATSAATPSAEAPRYNDAVLPILAENCFHCHGPDSGTRKARLRLDRFSDATSPRGEHPPAIVPGKPDESSLMERILSRYDDEVMPPPEAHKKMTAAQIDLLRRWIAAGAVYQEHWSLISPVRPALPTTPLAQSWARNPIDAFVAEQLAAADLKPAPEEDRPRLLRRAAFDLTGLPPTPTELAAFIADQGPDAYERAVDRMLASDASAEHFARHWLDAVRYADTHGIHNDNFRSIWPYRDWVVNAFRVNMPFDRFTIEQVAGDLVPGATLDQKVASGFNRCLPTTSEGGAIAEEYEAIYAKDRVETMSAVWLGLTFGCAACHDHKFDPVTQKDFYALAAFFRNNTMPAMDGNAADTRPSVFVPAVADRPRWTQLEKEIAALTAARTARERAAEADLAQWLAAAKSLVPAPAGSAAKRHVPLTGAAPDEPAGPFGPALRANRLDLVVGPPVALRRGTSESFSLLVRADGKPDGTLLSSLAADAKGSGWELFLEDGKPGFHLIDEKGGVATRELAKNALKPGVWHHVLLVFNTAPMSRRAVELSVDGMPAANSGEISDFPHDIVPTAPLRVGARQGADGRAAGSPTGGDVWVQDFRHFGRVLAAAEARSLADIVDAHTALGIEPTQRTAAQTKLLRAQFFAAVDAPSLALASQLDRLAAEQRELRQRGGVTLVMEEKKDSEPFARMLNRGDYSQPGEKVAAAVPQVLPQLPENAPRNRLALAEWLVDARNPLTARVTANRWWQHLFGTGLVETPGDFGVTGARPTHPALLDWLAVEFRESGWDQRRLVRLLVTSATYRQRAAASPAFFERDPANRLLARGPRYRLDAEQIRDQALAASGLMVAKLGGRPVYPYQPEGIWEEVAMKQSTTRFYRPDTGENLYRRSLYTILKRTAPPPAMDILNAPNREVSCVRRDRTNTPLQALVTLNEPLFVEASRHLAERALRESGSFDQRLDAIALRLLSRTFSAPERAVLRRTLDDALEVYRRDPAAARDLLAVGASPVDANLPLHELAAWTLVASQVFNLDEALTK